TTAADLQEVRKSETRVKTLADLETARYKLLNNVVRVNRLFDDAQKNFRTTIADNLKALNASLQVLASFLFSTDFQESISDVESRKQNAGEIVVPLAVPAACENVAHLNLQRPLDQY